MVVKWDLYFVPAAVCSARLAAKVMLKCKLSGTVLGGQPRLDQLKVMIVDSIDG